MQLLLSMLAAALPGTWTSPCTTTDEGVLANQRATFTENSTIQTVNQADDLYCSHVVMANSVEASYTVGTPTDFATPIDYTITKVTVVVQDPEYVEAANEQTFCGSNDWQLNVAKDVAGMNCDGAPMPRVGDHAYDILQITGMSLFFGDRTVDGSDGTTPTSRPSALDTTTPFERSALAN